MPNVVDVDDDEGAFGGMYEGGHWIWDDKEECLNFISELTQTAVEAVSVSVKAPTGTIEFRDDVDVMEQIRFRKRYQRKVPHGEPEVITIQDIKDIALFTAPLTILSPMLINLLHLQTTERFMRALILYCQYYLQIADVMAERMAELETKIRTPLCNVLEDEFRNNLGDLRLLVSKEYFTMLIGGDDTGLFHHMGAQKKRRSLSDKDARLFETLIRMCVQIVWLALGRKSFNQIELEVNRIFKTEIYNAVEHNLKTGYLNKMTIHEKAVLLGTCVRRKDRMLKTGSPLNNAVFCHKRNISFRIFGLGVIQYPTVTPRLKYMLLAIASPEEFLLKNNVTIGILGMGRELFDTTLHPLPSTEKPTKSKQHSVGSARNSKDSSHSAGAFDKSATSTNFKKSTTNAASTQIYPDIVLPPWEGADQIYPPHFPDTPAKASIVRKSTRQQRIRWQNRYQRLLCPERVSVMDSRKSTRRSSRKPM